MGNDGGSIPGRKDLVREKGREKKMENNDLVKSSQSKYCCLTKEPLKRPVVGCRLGFLYNKEALINAMLDKRLPKIYSHIKSLKDVKDLNITLSELNGETKIICPISMIEFSGLNTFYFFWNCGCLISKKAFDELHMKDKCILCGAKFDREIDLVNINYSKEERARIFSEIMNKKLKNQKGKQEKQDISNNPKNNMDKKKMNVELKEENIINLNSDLTSSKDEDNKVSINYHSQENKNFVKDHLVHQKYEDNDLRSVSLKLEYINKKRKRNVDV